MGEYLNLHDVAYGNIKAEIDRLKADVKKWVRTAGENQRSANLCADEADRLRAEVERLKAENNRYREALEELSPVFKPTLTEPSRPEGEKL